MNSSSVELLLSKLPDAKKNANGWSARCPAHDDHRPSLSVAEGDDGRALVKCHAGCTLDAICGAVGLRGSDLMPHSSSTGTSTEFCQSREKAEYRRQSNGKPGGRAYPTDDAALDKCMQREGEGRRVTQWKYTDAVGQPVAVVVRYDLPTPEGQKQSKTFRPVSKHADGWHLCDPPGKWPLYGLLNLAGADRVYVCEGEKAADAAKSIGLTATTSAHGAGSPDKTDWSPLRNAEGVILPDNDQPGRKYADAVSTILAKQAPATKVRVLDLPGVPEHGDVFDFVAMRRAAGKTDDEIRAEIGALASAAEVVQPDVSPARMEQFEPFPTDALPEPIRGFVEAGTKAIGCDSSYLALPMLTALAAAIGNARRIRLKRCWSEPAIL